MNKFTNFKLNPQLFRAIDDLGYQQPTPIQQGAIPVALAGHDLLGIAQTGTGKTAAYLLPLLMKIKYARGNTPRALVLVPTRELTLQVDEEISKLGSHTDIRHVCVFGGKGIKPQQEAIEAGVDIVVGTPGRVIDLYQSGSLILKDINTLVLDEADRMMDMGFMPQIRQLLEVIPSKKRQNLLFSATMPPKVEMLSAEFLEFPERVEVTPQATTAETVDQVAYLVPNLKTKMSLLEYLLKDEAVFSRVMVFARSKASANQVYKLLQKKWSDQVRVIHANKDQNSRLNAMQGFRDGDCKILVATDVVARGIDVSMVSHVINFDVPVLYEEYVHRIGRTGRAENEGAAITFFGEAEAYHLAKIEALIRQEIPKLPIPAAVPISPTPFAEKQAIALAIDNQRKKEDPDFKGAFHEKKYVKKMRNNKSKPGKNHAAKSAAANQARRKGRQKK